MRRDYQRKPPKTKAEWPQGNATDEYFDHTVVSTWRKIGRRLRLKAATLDAYASAFENPLMDEARQLLRKY